MPLSDLVASCKRSWVEAFRASVDYILVFLEPLFISKYNRMVSRMSFF